MKGRSALAGGWITARGGWTLNVERVLRQSGACAVALNQGWISPTSVGAYLYIYITLALPHLARSTAVHISCRRGEHSVLVHGSGAQFWPTSERAQPLRMLYTAGETCTKGQYCASVPEARMSRALPLTWSLVRGVVRPETRPACRALSTGGPSFWAYRCSSLCLAVAAGESVLKMKIVSLHWNCRYKLLFYFSCFPRPGWYMRLFEFEPQVYTRGDEDRV